MMIRCGSSSLAATFTNCFRSFSRKFYYVDRQIMKIPNNADSLPLSVNARTFKKPVQFKQLPILRNDYLRFKLMSGNEILLNMEYNTYFRPSEIVASLLALAQVPDQEKFDWEAHPYVTDVLDKLIQLMPRFKKQHIFQSLLILDRLHIKSDKAWNAVEDNLKKVYHQLSPIDCYKVYLITFQNNRIMKSFNEIYMNLIAGHLEKLSAPQLATVLNIYTKLEYRSKRFLENYFCVHLERKVKKLNYEQYIMTLRNLILNNYDSDLAFWHDSYLPHIYDFELNYAEAQNLKKELYSLKLSFPAIDIYRADAYLSGLEAKLLSKEQSANTADETKPRMKGSWSKEETTERKMKLIRAKEQKEKLRILVSNTEKANKMKRTGFNFSAYKKRQSKERREAKALEDEKLLAKTAL